MFRSILFMLACTLHRGQAFCPRQRQHLPISNFSPKSASLSVASPLWISTVQTSTYTSSNNDYSAVTTHADTTSNVVITETVARSAVKALLWRCMSGAVTLASAMFYTGGNLAVALNVVCADFGNKAMTMFVGERMFNRSQAGRKNGSDGVGRSLTKALVWRLFSVMNTLMVAFFVSKDLSVASKIASTDAVFKTSPMYFYERAWAKVTWGLQQSEQSQPGLVSA